MARLVMKFGGTSVADIERIRNVARHACLARSVERDTWQRAISQVHKHGLVLFAARTQPLRGRVRQFSDAGDGLNLGDSRREVRPLLPCQFGGPGHRHRRETAPRIRTVGTAQKCVQPLQVDLVAFGELAGKPSDVKCVRKVFRHDRVGSHHVDIQPQCISQSDQCALLTTRLRRRPSEGVDACNGLFNGLSGHECSGTLREVAFHRTTTAESAR